VTDDAWRRLEDKERAIAELTEYLRRHRHGTDPLEHWLRRTEITWEQVVAMHPEVRSLGTPADALEQVVLEAKYSGYIGRQAAQVERFQKLESKPIPAHFDFAAVPQLRAEAKEKLNRIRPASLGQASRISGISPADLAVLMIYLD
jgi:tRNA uridine 5-carboxymethylaminomethyl modification enzyme